MSQQEQQEQQEILDFAYGLVEQVNSCLPSRSLGKCLWMARDLIDMPLSRY
jgi:hypothetical protein